MMKYITLFLLIFSLSFEAKAESKKPQKKRKLTMNQRIYRASVRSLKQKQYNLSLYYLFAYLKRVNKFKSSHAKMAESILKKTGTLPLYLYDISFLDQLKIPTVSIHLAHHYFKEKNYDKAIQYGNMVPEDSSYYSEAQMLVGSALQILEKGGFEAYLDRCVKSADDTANSIDDTKYRRYFVLIKEKCLASKAREVFKRGDYKGSNEIYGKVAKKSYSWPYVLMEKAWNYYHLRDYNRTLGISMTYQSPLLESYFLPEVEVLKALSYYQLCLYRDAAFLIDKFFKVYKQRSDTLVSFIKSAIHDKFYFNLIYDEKENLKQHPYILSLRNQLRKKLRVNLHLYAYQKAKNEYETLLKNPKRKTDLKFLKFTLNRMETIINKHVKEYFYYFINQINFFSYEMFNIKLEIITRKKDLLYGNKKLISTRARGNFDNIQRDSEEFFFTFTGAFWADELGDYSFGLKSNCKSFKKGS